MSVLAQLHEVLIYQRRVNRLSELLCRLVPPNCSLLDVGCGDGKLAWSLMQKRPDLQIDGVDVLLRNRSWLPVKAFDGQTIPCEPSSFDGIMLIDVLHHTKDPLALLREALRVSRRWLIVKDHVLKGLGADWRLRMMDYVGNSPHGVALPYNHLFAKEWDELRRALDLNVIAETTDLHLYPWLADLVFGADMHFLQLLERRPNRT